MKIFFTFLLSTLCQVGFSQSAESYLEKIRSNEAELTAFFSQMPKGGDLHHHYSGSIYAEPLLAYVIAKDFYLTSNKFILKVKENLHPILLYKKFEVPIVICTDDAGILRTNMTEQYVLLAKRYPTISYADIKQFVYNSINYSFIQDAKVKKQLVQDLDNRFKSFESNIEQITKIK